MSTSRKHLLALAALTFTAADAAEFTWDGNGTNALWSFAAGAGGNTNWVQLAPATGSVLKHGDPLVFAGNQRLQNTNDYVGLSVSGLMFKAGAGSFQLGGEALTLTGDLVNASTQQQRLSFAKLVVGSRQTWHAASGSLLVDDFELGDHALTLVGTVTADVRGTLKVGVAGSGSLTAGRGSSLQTGGVWLAERAGSQGEVMLDQGALMTNYGLAYVGLHGSATLTVRGGAQLLSQGGHLGRFADGRGDALLTGNGSTWVSATSQALEIGYQGQGSLRVEKGARLTAQVLGMGKQGGRGTLSVQDAGTVAQVARATLDGSSLLTLADGAQWSGIGFAMGTASHEGLAQLRVNGGSMTLTGQLVIGSDSDAGSLARLTLLDGRVSAPEVQLRNSGSLVLAAGTLEAGQLALSPQAQFRWTGGDLRLGNLLLAQQGAMGPQLSVCGGCSLAVMNTLTLRSDGMLQLGSGAGFTTPLLSLEGGRVQAHTLDLDRVGRLSGHGTVAARVQGGGWVDAAGRLTLGDADADAGVDLRGPVTASGRLTLLDANLAELGGAVTVNDGTLDSLHGIHLRPGASLVVQAGSSHVAGDFVNDGRIEVYPMWDAHLSFHDAVSGNGSFTGAVSFDAGLAPGGADIGTLRFSSGIVGLGQRSVLTLDVGADGRADQLLLSAAGMGLGGELVLRFGSGFSADAGTTLQLIRGGALAGQPRFSVQGFDARRVDFSHFMQDGSVTISPVPEAPPSLMLLSGSLLLAGWLKRRQRREAQSSLNSGSAR